MARVIVGTAGHIDHGKSALVRALTGTDPDRLPEEKRRGITLDLGYAFLDDVAAIIDVPGHERLIRNMVAGAATVDFALLVVAADDGVMPQTREHLSILALLGVRYGAITVTKVDGVADDWIELVEEQIYDTVRGTFLESAPLYRVDSLSGRGVPEFRERLMTTLRSLPARPERGVFRLPMDRVFTIRGRGTVVTGTIISGEVHKDARLAVMPGGFDIRVKRLETQGGEADLLRAGQRAALNLIGQTEHLARGGMLTIPDALLETSCVRVAIDLLPKADTLKDRQRIRFLIGTHEAIGRLQLIERMDKRRYYANVLLESEIVTAWGDRFVLRRYSPLETLGGGTVLEPTPPPFRARTRESEAALARSLHTESLADAIGSLLKGRGLYGLEHRVATKIFAISRSELNEILTELPQPDRPVEVGEYLLLRSRVAELRLNVVNRVNTLHDHRPDSPGFSRSDLFQMELARLPDTIRDFLLTELVRDGKLVQESALYRATDRGMTLRPDQQELSEDVLDLLRQGAFAPPSALAIAETLKKPREQIEKALVLLDRMGKCRRLGNDLFFTTEQFDDAIAQIRKTILQGVHLTVSEAARLLGSSRKFVVPFLEHLDGIGITQRVGNVRVAGRTARDV
ncbi:selenocysteine-specific translation elongation factor [bacterium]|nr:selenocysteine-specific translation elongation factor [bacterium]MBU1985317.1 selenocysteine-specific translation elongation factor [bacterium]